MTCNLEHDQILKDKAATIAKTLALPRILQGVDMQGYFSNLQEFNQLTRNLFPDALKRDNYDTFIPASIRVSKDANAADKLFKDSYQAYYESRGYSGKGLLIQERAYAGSKIQGQMTISDFNKEVSYTRHKLENDPTYQHPIEQVNKVAEMQNTRVMELETKADQAGLTKDIKRGAGGLSHTHDEAAWRALPDDDALKVAQDHFAQYPERYGTLQKAVDYFKTIRNGFRAGNLAESDTASIGNAMDLWGADHDEALTSRSSMMDPVILDKYNLLRTDALGAMHSYEMKMSRMIHFKSVLDNQGVSTISELKTNAANSMNNILAEVEKRMALPKSDPLWMPKDSLEHQRDILMKDMASIDDAQRAFMGTLDESGKFRDSLSLLKTLTMQGTLGGASLSHITNLGALPFRQGFMNTLQYGYGNLIKSFLPGSDLAKLNMAEFRSIGAAADSANENIIKGLVNPDVAADSLGKIKTATDYMTALYGKVSGLTYLNHYSEYMGGNTAWARLIHAIQNNESLSDLDKLAFAQAGIEPKDLPQILQTWKKAGGNTLQDSAQVNITAWEDGILKDKVSRFLYNEIHFSMGRGEAGATPAVFQKGVVGQLMGQFRGFTASAQSKFLVSGLQRHDATALLGMTTMVMLGYTSYAMKEYIAGREPDNNMGNVILQGMMHSGLETLMSSYAFGLNPWAKNAGTYGGDFLSQIIPAAGYLNSASQAAGGILRDGSVDPADLHNIRRLVPYQNIFYLRAAFDAVEKAINQSHVLQRPHPTAAEPETNQPKPRWKP